MCLRDVRAEAACFTISLRRWFSSSSVQLLIVAAFFLLIFHVRYLFSIIPFEPNVIRFMPISKEVCVCVCVRWLFIPPQQCDLLIIAAVFILQFSCLIKSSYFFLCVPRLFLSFPSRSGLWTKLGCINMKWTCPSVCTRAGGRAQVSIVFDIFRLTFYSPIHYIHLHARSHWTTQSHTVSPMYLHLQLQE